MAPLLLCCLWLCVSGQGWSDDLPVTGITLEQVQKVLKPYTDLASQGKKANPKAYIPYGYQMAPDTYQSFSYGRLSPNLQVKNPSNYPWHMIKKVKTNRLEYVGDEEFLFFNLFKVIDESHYGWRHMVDYVHPIHQVFGKGDRYLDPIYLFSALFWLNGSDRMLSIETYNHKMWTASLRRVTQFYALTAFYDSIASETEIAHWSLPAKDLFLDLNLEKLETVLRELSSNYEHVRYGEFARLLSAVVFFASAIHHGENTPVGVALRDQASIILKRLRALYPGASAPHYWAGIMQMAFDEKEQDFSDTITILETAMRAEPENPAPFLLIVNLYRHIGRHDWARKSLRRWGNLYEMNVEMEKIFLNLSGSVYSAAGDWDLAQGEFEKAYHYGKNLVSRAGLADLSFMRFQEDPESQEKLTTCAQSYDQLLVDIEDYEHLNVEALGGGLHGVFKQQFSHYYHRYFYLSSYFSSPQSWDVYVDSAISHFISYNSPRLVFRLLNEELVREFFANTLGYRFSTDQDLMTRLHQLEADANRRQLPKVSGNILPGMDGSLPPHALELPFDETKFVRLTLKKDYKLVRNALDVYDNDIFLAQLNKLLKELIWEMMKNDDITISCYVEENEIERPVPLNYVSGQTVLLTIPKATYQKLRQEDRVAVIFKTSSGMNFGLNCKETQVLTRKDAYLDVMYQFVELSADQNDLLTTFINLYDTLK
jgi:tetratricopeptide (TPR) repeat protein